MRDAVVDVISGQGEKTGLARNRLLGWLGLGRSKFYGWKERYGRTNEHNGQVPRDCWVLDWEREAIRRGFIENPTEGYRRLTYMLMDAGEVAVSPSTTYRILKQEGLLDRGDSRLRRKVRGTFSPCDLIRNGIST